jgi:hypothetical protein
MNSGNKNVPEKYQCDAFKYFLERYKDEATIQAFAQQFKVTQQTGDNQQLIELYEKSIPAIERLLWRNEANIHQLEKYQLLFQELELLYSNKSSDNRHHFIIAIPVADRPQHLKQCLQSLLNLCKRYNYGGLKESHYTKLQVLIADDSKQLASQQANKQLAEDFTKQGIKVEYFGTVEQQAIIKKYKNSDMQLDNMIGNISADNFYHKGASITRNISYLKLNELRKPNQSTLFYFIDSDQEFQVKIKTQNDESDVYAVNYFYYLDKLFSNKTIDVLTGKVVGDPPVSPSVMAGNFLEDLIAFLSKIATHKQHTDCEFHQHDTHNADDAAYHDMADLFGFKPSIESFQYNCMIKGPHDHTLCLNELSDKLKQFFDGEHPTRKSYYEHEDVEANTKPARTIYTGNYIFNENGLQYFIPFANLKLRMAGPVLGRIIKSDIAERFVSANLPMLHKRTVQTIKQSEFRPGVEHQESTIDLSGEFTRQFYGDVMLFSMQSLTELGYPGTQVSSKQIAAIVENTINSMKEKYSSKHKDNIKKINHLKIVVNNPQHWWNTNTDLNNAKLNFTNFIQNIEFNFGTNARVYSQLFSASSIAKYQMDIIAALLSYTSNKSHWNNLLKVKSA